MNLVTVLALEARGLIEHSGDRLVPTVLGAWVGITTHFGALFAANPAIGFIAFLVLILGLGALALQWKRPAPACSASGR